MVALIAEELRSIPEVPSVSVPPLPILTGSVAPELSLMPDQLAVPEFRVNPVPSDPVSQRATSLVPGAAAPDQLAPAVRSVPVAALVRLAANAEGALDIAASSSTVIIRGKLVFELVGFMA